MVEIECLVCGKAVKLPQFIDTDKYDGQVVCKACKSILDIKLVKEKVQKYKIEKDNSKLNLTDLVIHMQQEKTQQEKGK